MQKPTYAYGLLHDTLSPEALQKPPSNKGDTQMNLATGSDTYVTYTNKKTGDNKCPWLGKEDRREVI